MLSCFVCMRYLVAYVLLNAVELWKTFNSNFVFGWLNILMLTEASGVVG